MPSLATQVPVLQRVETPSGQNSLESTFVQDFRLAVKLETNDAALTADQAYKIATKLGFSDNLQRSKQLLLRLVNATLQNKSVSVLRLQSVLLQI
jgi:hypothetical protein